MEQKFKTLFDLTVTHTYYTSGYANDFVFSPTAQTAKDLSRYKLLARQKHGVNGSPEAYGLKVSYSEVDTAPLIPITATDSPSLVFGLNLKNTRFLNITNEAELPAFAAGKVLYVTNAGLTAIPDITLELTQTPVTLRRKVFEFNFTLVVAPESATIEILDASDTVQTIYTQNLENEAGNYQALIDLNGLDDGIYTVRVLDDNGDEAITISTMFYISDELAAMRPMAILDLKVVGNSDLSTSPLEIDFTPRSVRLKYWVVNLKPVAGAITVDKAGIPFTEDIDAPDLPMDINTKAALETQYPSPAVVRLFVSDNLVPLVEEPTKDIKLKRGSTVLIKHLPGMPVDSPKTEAYIYI